MKDLNSWVLPPYVDKSHFKLIKVIGIGEQSVIWLVQRRAGKRAPDDNSEYFFNRLTGGRLEFIEAAQNKGIIVKKEIKEESTTYKDAKGNVITKEYAMKIMDKRRLYEMRSIECIKQEMNILAKVIHPFILYLEYAFHDEKNAYMVTEYLKGGDLRYYLDNPNHVFEEKQAQFIIACVILAVEFLHNNGIVHRDIRPENIIFDKDGYCKLADFCLARIWSKNNANDTSGHAGYLAPEVMLRENHSTAVDYFQIGIVAHELMLRTKPWPDDNREVYRENLVNRQVILKKISTPENWGHEASDFINKCIKRKQNQRLGLNGPSELRNHIWFREFEWVALQHRKVIPPFKPAAGDNFDKDKIYERLRRF